MLSCWQTPILWSRWFYCYSVGMLIFPAVYLIPGILFVKWKSSCLNALDRQLNPLSGKPFNTVAVLAKIFIVIRLVTSKCSQSYCNLSWQIYWVKTGVKIRHCRDKLIVKTISPQLEIFYVFIYWNEPKQVANLSVPHWMWQQPQTLIYCKLVMPYDDLDLVQVMACCLTIPRNYLNQCSLIINKVL